MRYLPILFFAGCMIWVSSVVSVAAQDACPSALNGSGSYVLSRRATQTEVFYDKTPIIRTLLQSRGRTLLETTEYEGLVQLERIDRGRRTVYKPKSDLSKLLPLKLHRKISFVFDAIEGQTKSISTATFEVVGSDSLSIGPCKYDIVKIAHDQTHKGNKWRQTTDFYAPELRMVVAKEHTDRGGRVVLIKYDRISKAP